MTTDDDKQAQFMFINPMLAITLEASLLERDMLDGAPYPDRIKRLHRIVDLARQVRGIELPLRVAIAAPAPPPTVVALTCAAAETVRKLVKGFVVIDGDKR